jgi:hypothetical protein
LLDTSATVVSYSIDPVSGALAPGSSTVVGNGAFLIAPDPTGRFLYAIYYGGRVTGGQSWNDLTSFSIATSGVNAGAVSLNGQETQFPSGAIGGGEIAIVE